MTTGNAPRGFPRILQWLLAGLMLIIGLAIGILGAKLALVGGTLYFALMGLLAVLLGIATVILILLCQYFWPGGVQPGGVVLCIVLFSTPVETYVAYSLNRIFDTAVGVIVALLVNYFLPRERVVACWEKVKGLFRPVEHT